MIDNPVITRIHPSAQMLVSGLFLGDGKNVDDGKMDGPVRPADFRRTAPLRGVGTTADRPARGLFGRNRQYG